MFHELQVLCIIFYRQYRTDMIVDLDGALPLVYFPMAMSGVRVAECS